MTESENRRCAVVTGSTRGIGRAVARELAAAGMNVVVNSSSERSLPAAEAVAAEIAEEFGVETLAVAANVAIEEEANALIAAAAEANGRVDVLVNNAGITRDGLAARMSDDDFDAVIDINLKGTFHCCRAAAKLMMKQRWGRIVNMSSVVGVYGNAGQVNYAASKAGVIGLTKSLARELARRNITANAVAPGFIATDMTDALSDAQREAIVSRIGAGALGDRDDIAHLCASSPRTRRPILPVRSSAWTEECLYEREREHPDPAARRHPSRRHHRRGRGDAGRCGRRGAVGDAHGARLLHRAHRALRYERVRGAHRPARCATSMAPSTA